MSCTKTGNKTVTIGQSSKILVMDPKIVNSDSLLPPDKITIKDPEITPVPDFKPRITGKSNSFNLGPGTQIVLKEPVIKTVGNDGLKEPVRNKVIEKKYICGSPEIITVKPPSFRDENPANFCSYNKLQGLKHDQVRGMDQDSSGNLWLATDDGLIRYDGKYFLRYSTIQGLSNNLILAVCTDKSGNIWAGAYLGGLMKYDGKYLYRYTSAEGLAGENINTIYSDPFGILWIGTSTGLTRYDGEEFINYTINQGLCHNDIRSLNMDKNGSLWIGTYGGGISIFDGKEFRNYTRNEGLIQDYISAIYFDRNDNIWIGSAGRGIMKFDGHSWAMFGKKDGFGSDSFTTIEEDSEGNLWFGSLDNGLTKLDGERITVFTEQEGLSSNIIRSSLSDNEGHLWFGTRGGGFVRYNGNLFTHLSEKEGLSNSRVMSVLEDRKGNLWLGTFSRYITKLTFSEKEGFISTGISYLGEKEGLLNSRIYSVEEDSAGNIWMASDGGGASRFDGKTITTFTSGNGLCSSYLRDILVDRSGAIWFASYGYGVSKFDGKSFQNYSVNQGLSSGTILSIFQDSSGNYWFGTADKGLCRFDGKNFIHYTPENGFPGITVYAIMQDHLGNIWFGTGGAGVVIYDGKDFRNITFEANSDYEHILAIYQDSRKNIWLGTRFGPIVINSNQIDSFIQTGAHSTYIAYDFEDGFTGIGFNLQAIEESKDGTIWMGTTDRLTAFHPGGQLRILKKPTLMINRIKLFNEDLNWTNLFEKQDTSFVLHNGVEVGNFKFSDILKWSGQPEDLSLKYDNNYLTISFIAVALSGNEKIQYQYMLEGLDDHWNLPTDQTDVSYGNLQPGKYVFRLRATERFGTEADELNYSFSIRPPWWGTIWFYFLVFAICILMILGYIRLRIRKLKMDRELLEAKVALQTSEILEKNKELTRISAEKDKLFSIIAHDLRSPLGVFLGFTKYISEDLRNMRTEEIAELTERMKTSAENLFQLLENLLEWARNQRGNIPFNPVLLNVLSITEESISVLREQADQKKVSIRLEIPYDQSILADKNMIQLVIRNLVSNAIKFTHCGGSILISSQAADGGKIRFSVRDTGIGMDDNIIRSLFNIDSGKKRKGTEGELSTGLGLLLCKEFIEKHNGIIWAESKEGKGSVFYFLV